MFLGGGVTEYHFYVEQEQLQPNALPDATNDEGNREHTWKYMYSAGTSK